MGITSPKQASGDSFYVYLLPYIEQQSLAAAYPLSTDTTGTTFNVYSSSTKYNVLNNVVVKTYACPGSPLTTLGGLTSASGVKVQQSDYIGIAGAVVKGANTNSATYDNLPGYQDGRLQVGANSGSGCCGGSIVSGNGVLFPNSDVKIAAITDGTSNTMVLGEQSDFVYLSNGTKGDFRGYSGWADGNGASSTTNVTSQLPNWLNSNPASVSDQRMKNLTTIRYSINQKGFAGNCGTEGVCQNYGSNNPLRSAHDGGINVAYADGSIHVLSASTSMATLAALAIRDDGQAVDLP